MLRHLMTTISEQRVREYLEENSEDVKKAFVLTSRIPNDSVHLRYDVFQFVKDIDKD